MKTLILPGFSTGNQEFLDTVGSGFSNAWLWHWPHWQSGQDSDFDANIESQKLINLINEPVYIVAKSVGTFVAMKILQSKANLIYKLILNGIPMKGLSEEDKKIYQKQLVDFDATKLLVFQNKDDQWGKYAEVKAFMHRINPKIRVISMPRSDHAYPYVDEFKKFLI